MRPEAARSVVTRVLDGPLWDWEEEKGPFIDLHNCERLCRNCSPHVSRCITAPPRLEHGNAIDVKGEVASKG
jgi:hypothetical protein